MGSSFKSIAIGKPTANLSGLEKYVGSGLIKGVGPVSAKRIVAHFGLDTLDIIEHDIERLIEVPGIAQKRVKLIQKAWAAQKSIKDVMLFLQGHGVSTAYAVKIFKQYGDEAIETVSQNPYQLAKDVYGIGFVTADAIARNLGIAPGSEFRYCSGVLHVLGEASEDGHCFLPQAELVERIAKRLTLPDHEPNPDALLNLTTQMGVEGELVMQGSSGGPGGAVDLLCAALLPGRTESGGATAVITDSAINSQIVRNAHRINQGQFPHLEAVSNQPRSDCLWLGAPEPEEGVQAIQNLITDVIPQLGFDPARDVQVASAHDTRSRRYPQSQSSFAGVDQSS